MKEQKYLLRKKIHSLLSYKCASKGKEKNRKFSAKGRKKAKEKKESSQPKVERKQKKKKVPCQRLEERKGKEIPNPRLKEVEQSAQHHPEGSVWNHTMMVVDEAAKRKESSENPDVFMWAALLHDLGKKPTTKLRKGRITSYDHDVEGAKIARKFLEEIGLDNEFVDKVSYLVRWHMQLLFVLKDLPFADIKNMILEVSPKEIALLSLCDRLGRGEMTPEKIKEEEENIRKFIEKVNKYQKSNIKK